MFRLSSILLAALVSGVVMAQPPEELPPPLPETAPQETFGTVKPVAPLAPIAAPVIAPVAVPVAVQVIPVAEPQAAGPTGSPIVPKAPETVTVAGMKLSPSFALYPFGYDSLNIGGGTPTEGGRYFLGVKPAISLDSTFKTANERDMTFSFGYEFLWREYYNKSGTNRDLASTFSGSLGTKWTPTLSTTLPASFDYTIKNGNDNADDSAWTIDTNPDITIKALDNLSFKAAYYFWFTNSLNSAQSESDINLETGPLLSDFDSQFGDFGVGFGSSPGNNENIWISDNFIQLSTSYTVIKGTKLGFNYNYRFLMNSNDDNQISTAHYVGPSISQDFPWEGGSISLGNLVRFLKQKYETLPSGAPVRTIRYQLHLVINQEITKNLSFEALYRLRVSFSNKDNYNRGNGTHWMYSGLVFAF